MDGTTTDPTRRALSFAPSVARFPQARACWIFVTPRTSGSGYSPGTQSHRTRSHEWVTHGLPAGGLKPGPKVPRLRRGRRLRCGYRPPKCCSEPRPFAIPTSPRSTSESSRQAQSVVASVEQQRRRRDSCGCQRRWSSRSHRHHARWTSLRLGRSRPDPPVEPRRASVMALARMWQWGISTGTVNRRSLRSPPPRSWCSTQSASGLTPKAQLPPSQARICSWPSTDGDGKVEIYVLASTIVSNSASISSTRWLTHAAQQLSGRLYGLRGLQPLPGKFGIPAQEYCGSHEPPFLPEHRFSGARSDRPDQRSADLGIASLTRVYTSKQSELL